MLNRFLETIVTSNKRYEGFTLLSHPTPFKNTPLFSDKYDLIQIHSTQPISKNDIVGFCGVCWVKDNHVVGLDGDSYSDNMIVVGYSEFLDDGELCLDLLVSDW